MDDSRRPLDAVLEALRAMPAFLRDTSRRFPEEAALAPRPGGGLCFLEQVWHLADLEAEGYGVRIDRILSEEAPALADFDGAQVARDRQYRSLSLADGLARFAEARARNLGILAGLAPSHWERGGTQAGVGQVRLSDVARMMAEHDASHREEIRELLGEAPPGSERSRVA
jgi:hypothetical protein